MGEVAEANEMIEALSEENRIWRDREAALAVALVDSFVPLPVVLPDFPELSEVLLAHPAFALRATLPPASVAAMQVTAQLRAAAQAVEQRQQLLSQSQSRHTLAASPTNATAIAQEMSMQASNRNLSSFTLALAAAQPLGPPVGPSPPTDLLFVSELPIDSKAFPMAILQVMPVPVAVAGEADVSVTAAGADGTVLASLAALRALNSTFTIATTPLVLPRGGALTGRGIPTIGSAAVAAAVESLSPITSRMSSTAERTSSGSTASAAVAAATIATRRSSAASSVSSSAVAAAAWPALMSPTHQPPLPPPPPRRSNNTITGMPAPGRRAPPPPVV